MSFPATLLGWHDFYMIAGAASASLVGLLFVGLSLHLRIVVTRPEVKGLARVTLTGFTVTLLVALFVVIPSGNDPTSIGWDLVGIGGAGLLINARNIVSGIRSEYRTLRLPHLLLRFGLSVASVLAVVAVGGQFVGGDFHRGFGFLAGVVIFMLLTSLRNSWDLLVTVGAAIQSPARS